MEYVYAAMLLHKAGQKIDESSLKKVLTSAGVKVDEAKVKTLVASLDGVDIEKVIEETQLSAGPATESKTEEKKEEKPKEEKPKEEKKEAAAEGLGALFG